VSKESQIKKKQQKINRQQELHPRPVERRVLTPEERASIIRDRLANRPVIMFRYPNGKYNKRLIITLALFIAAFIAVMFFLSQ
jgi:hypothetical protein